MIGRMTTRDIEPGLLRVFRLFAALRMFFALLFTAARLANPEQSVRILDLFEPALLLVLLALPLLTQIPERVVLPLALVVATVGPLLSNTEALMDRRATILPEETLLTLQTWGSMIVLLLPLVIIAWQYRFAHVTFFSLAITVLHVLLIGSILGFEALDSTLVISSIVARTVTFMFIGWLIVRLMVSQRDQRQALTEANTRLTHYASTLEQLATTRERNRLARELHDTLAHTLSAVAVQLEAVDALWSAKPDEAHTRLRKSIAATRSGLTETRRVLQDLRATPLEDLGLSLATRTLAESIASRAGLALDLHIQKRLGSLSPQVEQAVYRTAQEALSNVANHANAHCVTVQLARQKNTLTLAISDDGSGFDSTNVNTARSYGITGMQERAAMAGGTLKIESQPGEGTRILLAIEVNT